jgi:hypothetical protein
MKGGRTMGNIYKTAMSIYEESKDMDFMDYEETQEQDISYIISLLNTIGESATKALLLTF